VRWRSRRRSPARTAGVDQQPVAADPVVAGARPAGLEDRRRADHQAVHLARRRAQGPQRVGSAQRGGLRGRGEVRLVDQPLPGLELEAASAADHEQPRHAGALEPVEQCQSHVGEVAAWRLGVGPDGADGDVGALGDSRHGGRVEGIGRHHREPLPGQVVVALGVAHRGRDRVPARARFLDQHAP
jgi:hypothetical protein